jgi:outer membrane protein TolC
VIQLSLSDAIDRGLRQNLALLLGEQGTRASRAQRLRSLSDLLPNVTTRTAETAEQVNLAALGFSASTFPGVPSVIGPFGVFDTRANLSQRLFDWKVIQNTRSASENVKAAQLSYKDTRELVVLVVTNLYLQAVQGKSRVDVARAQVDTAKAVYQQAVDLERAGVAARIDVLRAQVEMQAQQQRLLSAENDLEKQKLVLARAIGLAVGQQFETSDKVPYGPLPPVTFEQALEDAFRNRPDYLQAQSLVRAAELARSAAVAGRFPTVRFDGDYGAIGPTPGNSHGTFTAVASLQVPIFQGGRVRADVQENDALLQERQAQLGDMRNLIESEVRTAFMDVNTAAKQVDVAQSSVALATEQLQQSRDRLVAGVANTLEVVQAQEALAAANDTYISALYAHNVAKASLARAVGMAERAIKQYLGGR